MLQLLGGAVANPQIIELLKLLNPLQDHDKIVQHSRNPYPPGHFYVGENGEKAASIS